MKGELIVTIVNNGFSGDVMDYAKKAGASGGTIVKGRGTNSNETEKLFGIDITPEKQVVLILAPKEKKDGIMKSIIEGVGLNTLGKGICFSLPVDNILGVSEGFCGKDTADEEELRKKTELEQIFDGK